MDIENGELRQLLADLQAAAMFLVRRPFTATMAFVSLLLAFPLGWKIGKRIGDLMFSDPSQASAFTYRTDYMPMDEAVRSVVVVGAVVAVVLIFFIHAWEEDGPLRWVWPLI